MAEKIWNTKNSLLTGLSIEEKHKLISLGKRQRFEKDEFIFQASHPDKSIHILLTGHAKISHVSSIGKEIILWFCIPGEIFGLAECLNGDERKAYAQACSQTTVLSVSEKGFKQFISEHPEFAMKVISIVSDRMRILSETLLSLATDDAQSRIRNVIIRLSQCYGEPVKDVVKINFNITHQEIADMTGTSRQTVTSTINQFKRKKLLYVSERKLYIYPNEWKCTYSADTYIQ